MKRKLGFVCLFLLVCLIGSTTNQAGQLYQNLAPTVAGDENWSHAFTLPGAYSFPSSNYSGKVYVSAVDSLSNLYIAGDFDAVGGVPARHIAKFDGVRWLPLGAGLDFEVHALTVDKDNNLFAAGHYIGYDRANAAPIMAWNGASWSKIGEVDFDSASAGPGVFSLVTDSTGVLYVGGLFNKINSTTTTCGLARWNGSSWAEIGGTEGGEAVYALEIDSLDDLYVGGGIRVYATLDHPELKYLARWSKGNWNDTGYSGNAVSEIKFSSAGNLFVIGSDGYSTNNCVIHQRIVTAWSEIGTFATIGTWSDGRLAARLAADNNGNVNLAGHFTSIAGVSANSIIRWNGSSWSPLGDGLFRPGSYDSQDAAVSYTAVVAKNGTLYVGGEIMKAGSVFVNNLARWNGIQWSGVGPGGKGGLGGDVLAVAGDRNGNLYAGGKFFRTEVGSMGPTLNYVACWNGDSWQAMGSGMNGFVRSLAVDPSGNLYAGGEFTQAGGQPAAYIARWNGSSWSAVGGGMDDVVNALTFDSNGNLYAGGIFDTAGGVFVGGLARWNGSSWQRPSGWCVSPPSGGCGVTALTSTPGGLIYMGGGLYFNKWYQLAVWDGNGFQPISGNPFTVIQALAADGNRTLYIGGYGSGSSIAAWDTIDWSWWTPGSGVTGGNKMVNALAWDGSGNLYAGGSFLTAGGAAIPSLARWNGSSWSALGSGLGITDQVSGSGAEVFALGVSSNFLNVGLAWLSGVKVPVGPMGVNGIARYSLSGAPMLQINFPTGRVGSYFTVGGWGFPPNHSATIMVNGRVLNSTLTTDSLGGLTFQLDTNAAGSGFYIVSVSVNPGASVPFTLDPTAPLRTQESSGPTVNIPAGIAAVPTYLPTIRR